MLTKFEARSSRVKAVALHNSATWVLCGLHNGAVQIWDYRMSTCVDTYTEHVGAVRGADFHVNQPLFVTGGDDYTVKVWNYKLRRCLFTMMGHMDYVRTTFFHHEQPWIVSCSDDFTIRIWNWQSRKSIACLPGHNHYVMCAQFHPFSDLVVSGSLDKTIRVWDISALRHRKEEVGITHDLLGTTDVVVRYELEGHEKGINWVAFHPCGDLLLSAADDRTVRLWTMSGTSCYVSRTFTGHTSNVCCSVFYRNDYLISCAEDRTIRVVHMSSGVTVQTFRREVERYWIMASDSTRNLIAIGHDAGLQVFKLTRERPAFAIHNATQLYYTCQNKLHMYNFETEEVASCAVTYQFYPPTALSCCPTTGGVMLSYANNGPQVEWIPKPLATRTCNVEATMKGIDGVFFGGHKLAYVDVNGKMCIQNVAKASGKPQLTDVSCSRIFPGPVGCVLCQSNDRILLYQVAQHGAVAEATVTGVRYAVWDKDFSKVALVAKNTVTIMTKRLKIIASVAESSARIKSAAFDETRDVMYFTTSSHLKYCYLRNGETSTISTLKNVVYLVRAVGDSIYVLTRDGRVLRKELDNVELNFKLKLQQQSYRDLIRIMQQGKLKGQALVGYLHKHGHSEIALHFVSDSLTRFNLAIECGAMDIAKATAIELNQPAIWRRLADTATSFGDIQLAQFASAKAGHYYASGLLALLTGNTTSVANLVNTTRDDNFKLHYSMYMDDAKQRVDILCKVNQLPLAYVTAKSHGLAEMAAQVLQRMEPEVAARVQAQRFHPAPQKRTVEPATENWPMLQVEESVFARLLKEPGHLDIIAQPELDEDVAAGTGWDDDEDDGTLLGSAGAGAGDAGALADKDEMGGGWDDDLDIDVSTALPDAGGATSASSGYVVPREHPPIMQAWADAYTLPAFHVAAGSFASALRLLQRQIGLADPTPLKPYMLQLWAAVNVCRPAPNGLCVVFAMPTPPPDSETEARHAPALPDFMPALAEKLRFGYQLFVEGKFSEALDVFRSILHLSVVTVVKDDQQKATLREIMAIAPEYTRALALQLQLRTLNASSVESLQLALYFTHFRLHRAHLTLALSQAMSKAYKQKNIKTAAEVARRLLEQDPPKNKAQQAAAIIAEADRNPTNAVEIDYDERNPFTICSATYKPMYKGVVSPMRCSYCLSPAHPSYKGTLCPVCKLAKIGVDSAGLVNRI
ncbi:putative coatomer alpha subunit [Leishmania infantum JPCM5]|uniref:Coatomer subunit alpha n=2 Tax=Leishmania infantum TaxID=5671 RepID=A0A6L0Y0W5_LEIIN|nr:putative coatomer alpha subunit [Leishmania infantum JPCM5]CAC9541810.1 coatomer_alpha_subunit_-_putative [Leishmania infantum]CAM71860.1 putative coatomer alpha subunit [Leishmania infantum JPCM5]SUZ45814.1 coatomer_alpha_subunit_-_putative [Leishmania infantum]|eukprot:XP_001468771.1 putative coatomer alpha subunit [Leishmania infantum JPCM5]